MSQKIGLKVDRLINDQDRDFFGIFYGTVVRALPSPLVRKSR